MHCLLSLENVVFNSSIPAMTAFFLQPDRPHFSYSQTHTDTKTRFSSSLFTATRENYLDDDTERTRKKAKEKESECIKKKNIF